MLPPRCRHQILDVTDRLPRSAPAQRTNGRTLAVDGGVAADGRGRLPGDRAGASGHRPDLGSAALSQGIADKPIHGRSRTVPVYGARGNAFLAPPTQQFAGRVGIRIVERQRRPLRWQRSLRRGRIPDLIDTPTSLCVDRDVMHQMPFFGKLALRTAADLPTCAERPRSETTSSRPHHHIFDGRCLQTTITDIEVHNSLIHRFA